MPRHMLVVVSTEVPEDVLRTLVLARAGADAEMLVVAPASGISRLDWLTNAEDQSCVFQIVLRHDVAQDIDDFDFLIFVRIDREREFQESFDGKSTRKCLNFRNLYAGMPDVNADRYHAEFLSLTSPPSKPQ